MWLLLRGSKMRNRNLTKIIQLEKIHLIYFFNKINNSNYETCQDKFGFQVHVFNPHEDLSW